jgi:hypothetical protein
MSIFDGGKTKAELQALRTEVGGLAKENKRLEGLIIDDIDTAQKNSTRYVGNSYRSYQAIIDELALKYQALAEWGCVQAGNIIDVRASFIIGQGLTVGAADKSKAENPDTVNALEFAKALMDYNDLDREMVQEYAKEAEIEGCFLGTLKWNADDKQVSLRFMSRVETKYMIIHPKEDYSDYERAEWQDGAAPMKLEYPEFVYARFGGRVHKPNEPTPKVGKCLTEIEGLSKALRDWREINRMFGAPIPHIECVTADEAKAMSTAVKDMVNNWRTRKLFAHTGKLTYLSPDPQSRQGIENEIITLAKVISGCTGVPVHFLGLPDLMSNRSTAENLMELVDASTRKERAIWTGTYQQILEKAADIWNAESGLTVVDPTLVKVSIPAVSPETWKRLTDVWLPLYTAQAISLQTFLEQVPGVDAGGEQQRLDEQTSAKTDQLMSRTDPNAVDPNAPNPIKIGKGA